MSAGHRDRSTLAALIELATILVVYRLQHNETPAKSTFWHAVMAGSQKVARTSGRLGMYAETRYRETVRH